MEAQKRRIIERVTPPRRRRPDEPQPRELTPGERKEWDKVKEIQREEEQAHRGVSAALAASAEGERRARRILPESLP